MKTVFSQQEILKKLRPVLESEGAVYHKTRNILARQAKGGERIETMTGDGLETINEAKPGDFIVQNQTEASEQYVVPHEEFLKKYKPLHTPPRNGFEEYRSTGKIVALELTDEKLKALGLPREFHFSTDWGEDMVAKAGDFLGGPTDYSTVYRLARKEFFETYSK